MVHNEKLFKKSSVKYQTFSADPMLSDLFSLWKAAMNCPKIVAYMVMVPCPHPNGYVRESICWNIIYFKLNLQLTFILEYLKTWLSCIDLILTNCPKNFQESLTLETGLLDFHKMVLTVFKSKAPNLTPKVVSYWKYKHFDSHEFELEVLNKLSMQDHSAMDYKNFKDTIIDSLNKHVPLKRKYLRTHHSNFITKELSKAIIFRGKIRWEQI